MSTLIVSRCPEHLVTAPRFTPADHVTASYLAHQAGEIPPEHITATRKALADLVGRTSDREMTRDERRLHAKYVRTIDAYRDDRTARFLRPGAGPHSII